MAERNDTYERTAGGKIETLRYLNKIVDDSVKRSRDKDQDSALTLAAKSGNKETVKYLVEELKFDPAYRGWHGRNAFLIAASGGQIEILRYLDKIVDDSVKRAVDNNNESALDLPKKAIKNREETVKCLVEELGFSL